ncbi:MAG: hypothetical protein IRZ13_12655 [Acetobacteraceae bacterium]|nr:hypothetical protein [Acetobacteraceae bacterium]
MFLTVDGAEAAARDSGVKVLAVSAAQRIPLLSNVLTRRELGVEVEGGNWFTLMGPARMPSDAVQRIAEATAEGCVPQRCRNCSACRPLSRAPPRPRSCAASSPRTVSAGAR